jgi:hypothetical protein
VTWAGAAGAEFAAAVQASVEALQQLGVELRGRHVAKRWQDVEPGQVLVPLSGGVLELGNIEPSANGLPKSDRSLRMRVLVDLTLKFGDCDLGSGLGRRRFHEVPPLAGQRINPGVDLGAETYGGKPLDVTAWTASTTCHTEDSSGTESTFDSTPAH